MIVTILIGFVGFLYDALEAILPVGNLPPTFAGAITSINSALNAFSYVLPVGVMLGTLGVVVGFEFVVWSFTGLHWLWRRLPFVGK